jgi:thymidylate synthase
MNKADYYYLKNLNNIKINGSFDKNPRPKYADGTPAHTKFITQVFEEYDIQNEEFPITTLRNTAIKMGINEVLWIFQKQTSSIEEAEKLGVKWWNPWDVGDGSVGLRYGATIKKYDLMNKLLNGLENDPFGRRHIINLFQESDLQETKGLYPCAYETIWSVRDVNNKYFLDLTLMQRSNDYITAGIINKVQYVALQMMVAGHCGYEVGKFCHLTQNLHIYDRHFDALEELLNKPTLNTSPKIILNAKKNFYNYTISDFEIVDVDGIKKINSNLEIAI